MSPIVARTPVFGDIVGVDPDRISRRTLATQTRCFGLPCGFVYVIPCLAILVEHPLATDTDTGRHRRTQGHSTYHSVAR